MKVALVIHSNILNKVDGMTSYYKRLCRYFPAPNHQLDVFMQDPGAAETVQKNSVRFFFVRVNASFQPLPEAYLSFNPIYYLKLAWYFYGVFRKENYSCLQIASAHPISLAAVGAAKRLGIPVIGSYHTLLPEYVRYWSNRKFEPLFGGALIARLLTVLVTAWTKIVYGAADLILVPTARVKQNLQIVFGRKKIEVVGRGVEAEFFRPQPKVGSKLTALYVGRISVEKDLAKLAFFNRRRDIELHIVGDGEDLADLRKILPSAEFKGQLQNEKLARAYGQADIFVFPSKTDAYANVVSEALCAGLPVVAYREAGVEDRVKDGVNGFLVTSDAEFEDAVARLENKKLRRKMSRQARKTARDLKWEVVLKRQMAAFETAIEERQQKLTRFFPILRQVLYGFNFSHALLGSIRMGFYVFLANASAGFVAGLGAGMRQSLISFLMVGFNTSFFEFLYVRNRKLAVILPSILTTGVGTTIHLFCGTPNITATAATILGLALFNFALLSEIHRRHETISPWELTRIFARYTSRALQGLSGCLKKKSPVFGVQLQGLFRRFSMVKSSK